MSETARTEPSQATPLPDGAQPDAAQVKANVIAALRTIYDPEIPVNIYDPGLVYGLDIDATGKVDVRMTLTAPACPVAGSVARNARPGRGPTSGCDARAGSRCPARWPSSSAC